MKKVKESISIKKILCEFHQSVRECTSLFYKTPIAVGVLLPFLLKGGNAAATITLNSFLTSFVPLFGTILTFYMSWCYSEITTRHNGHRLKIFRSTSMDILMMIPLDALALVLYVCSTVRWFDGMKLTAYGISLPSFLSDVTWNDVVTYPFLAAYYAVVVELMLILLVVCKRAYIIIDKEIILLKNKQHDEGNKG